MFWLTAKIYNIFHDHMFLITSVNELWLLAITTYCGAIAKQSQIYEKWC